MVHQIDNSGIGSLICRRPRSVVANGEIYLWKDGRQKLDTSRLFSTTDRQRSHQRLPGDLFFAANQLRRGCEGTLPLETLARSTSTRISSAGRAALMKASPKTRDESEQIAESQPLEGFAGIETGASGAWMKPRVRTC